MLICDLVNVFKASVSCHSQMEPFTKTICVWVYHMARGLVPWFEFTKQKQRKQIKNTQKKWDN